ncbi:MAG: c-type cytochrome biogenesis protein CcmI, partial [Candidatus Puniceispirillum sp.]
MITDGFDFAAVPVLIAGSALGLALAGLMIKVIATAWIGADQHRGQDDLDQQLDLLRAERQRLEDAGKRNAISAAECTAAMQDIDRRLLAIADRIDQKAGQKTSGRALIWGLAVLVPTTSIALYLFLGSPATPDRPYANRTAEIAAARSANAANTTAAATALRDAIKASEDKPDVVESWLRLAEAAAGVADAETEIRALRTAIKLTGDDPAIMAMLAEALSRAADGQITVPARELINKVLAADPDEPRALFMSGLARYQDGDYAAAVSIWQRLL